MSKKVIALAGNPNSGKTTLFNALTGATAYVGNWPGVTVEQRKGNYKKDGIDVEIVDLPGIYSLSPYTPEEVIARNFVLDEKPDAIINIIDATNLERNLYLTTQLMEMDVPIVVALNMIDAVEKNGQNIDAKGLSEKLGVPVVTISALKNKGIKELMHETDKVSNSVRKGTTVLDQTASKDAVDAARAVYEAKGIANPLFHAIKALEKDEIELEINKVAASEAADASKFDGEFDEVSADERYKYISNNLSGFRSGKIEKEAKKKLTRSDKIDRVLTNKWAGIPIFLGILLIVFALTFSEDMFFLGRLGVVFNTTSFEGTIFEGLLWHATEFEEVDGVMQVVANGGINSPGVILANFLNGIMGVGDVGILEEAGDMVANGVISHEYFAINGWWGLARNIDYLVSVIWQAPDWTSGLVNAVIADGFFAVLGFLPQILVLFIFFSILEDCGYMARVAFIFDRIFRRMGLSGRAFIPMLMGYGCGVPAMINTRTLNTDKERTATIRAIAFFPCGAKMALLAAIAGVLANNFGLNAVLFSYSFYVIGLILAVAMVILMHWTTLREKVPPFIMELPSYHAPQFKSLMIHVWDKTKHYLKKAATIIIVAAVVIWFGTHFRWAFWQGYIDEGYDGTILESIGNVISYIFVPLGFGPAQVTEAWSYSLATITGIVAKEVVPETLEVISGGNLEAFVAATGISIGGFLSFIIFNLMTIPCFASIGTARGELGKGQIWKTLAFWITTSYILGALTYISVDYTWTLAITIPAIVGLFVGAYFYNRKKTKEEMALEEGKVA